MYYLFDDFEIVEKCNKLQYLADTDCQIINEDEIRGNCMTFVLLLIYLFTIYKISTHPDTVIDLILNVCNNDGSELKNLANRFTEFGYCDFSINNLSCMQVSLKNDHKQKYYEIHT